MKLLIEWCENAFRNSDAIPAPKAIEPMTRFTAEELKSLLNRTPHGIRREPLLRWLQEKQAKITWPVDDYYERGYHTALEDVSQAIQRGEFDGGSK